jgi:hypothetical protein
MGKEHKKNQRSKTDKYLVDLVPRVDELFEQKLYIEAFLLMTAVQKIA